MLFHDSRKFASKVQFPLIAQPKLDGIRAMYNRQTGIYSRLCKPFNVPDIKSALDQLTIPDSVYLDGELYIHHTPLQTISSIVRKSDHPEKNQLNFVLFDLYDRCNPSMCYRDRLNLLSSIVDDCRSDSGQLIQTVPIDNQSELDNLFNTLSLIHI